MPKLLVADDEQSVRDTLAYFLRQAGYEVVVAENGMKAIELFATETFDGALIDLLMPGLDGLTVSRTLREKAAAAGRDFPVWIVTGARSYEAEVQATQLGARAFISKPFNWVEFQAMLEREFNHSDPSGSTSTAPVGGSSPGS